MKKITEKKECNVSYVCGSCKHKFELKIKDLIRCPNCGYRILYKERTKNYIEYSTN